MGSGWLRGEGILNISDESKVRGGKGGKEEGRRERKHEREGGREVIILCSQRKGTILFDIQ